MKNLASIGFVVALFFYGCSYGGPQSSSILASHADHALSQFGHSFPSTGQFIATYPAPWLGKNGAMTIGPDGNIWVLGLHTIAKVTTSGQMTTYGADDVGGSITHGPGGSIWYTRPDGGLGWISTSGYKHKVALPSGDTAGDLVQGPDSNVWFTDGNNGAIGKVGQSGAVTEYVTPGEEPGALTATNAGLWFLDDGGQYTAFATTDGQITETGVGGFACWADSTINYGQGGVLAWITCVAAGCGGLYQTVSVLSDGGPRLPCGENGCFFNSSTVLSLTAPHNPDTVVWYGDDHFLGEFAIGPGTFTKIPLPNGGFAADVLWGPDKNIWITDTRNRLIYVYNPG
jgi:streptogramin lyase